MAPTVLGPNPGVLQPLTEAPALTRGVTATHRPAIDPLPNELSLESSGSSCEPCYDGRTPILPQYVLASHHLRTMQRCSATLSRARSGGFHHLSSCHPGVYRFSRFSPFPHFPVSPPNTQNLVHVLPSLVVAAESERENIVRCWKSW